MKEKEHNYGKKRVKTERKVKQEGRKRQRPGSKGKEGRKKWEKWITQIEKEIIWDSEGE